MTQTETSLEELLETLKRSSATLPGGRVPFVLGDGVAVWARGGPETEHDLDYDGLLEIPRPVREQVDWDEVRRRTEDSPYAKAFLTLVDELEVST